MLHIKCDLLVPRWQKMMTLLSEYASIITYLQVAIIILTVL